MIRILIEEDDQKKDILYSSFIQELQRNIVPVIKDRTVPRNKKSKKATANRYAKAKRRCL